MPIRLLVRAEGSPTFPGPGSWAKGDIVISRPAGWVWGNKETLPLFLRIDITNVNSADLGWLQESTGGDGTLLNRRQVRVNPTEVDAIKAQWAGIPGPAPTVAHTSFNRAQFNSRVVTRQ